MELLSPIAHSVLGLVLGWFAVKPTFRWAKNNGKENAGSAQGRTTSVSASSGSSDSVFDIDSDASYQTARNTGCSDSDRGCSGGCVSERRDRKTETVKAFN